MGDICDPDFVACGPGELYEPIIEPNATVNSGDSGLNCLLCSVSNEGNVIDTNLDNAARISIPLGVGGNAFIRVTDTDDTYSGAHRAGFVVENPDTLLDLALLQTITVSTLLNGAGAESDTGGTLLTFSLLNGGNRTLVAFDTSQDFNQLQVSLGALASLLNQLDVYSACVAPSVIP